MGRAAVLHSEPGGWGLGRWEVDEETEWEVLRETQERLAEVEERHPHRAIEEYKRFWQERQPYPSVGIQVAVKIAQLRYAAGDVKGALQTCKVMEQKYARHADSALLVLQKVVILQNEKREEEAVRILSGVLPRLAALEAQHSSEVIDVMLALAQRRIDTGGEKGRRQADELHTVVDQLYKRKAAAPPDLERIGLASSASPTQLFAAPPTSPAPASPDLAQAIGPGGLFGGDLPVPDKPPLAYSAGFQGEFIVSLAQDRAGGMWVGTEDHGVWYYDRTASPERRWRQFTTRDGLGDDHAYALAVDTLGRVWVGHLNHGVSVYDGRKWRNYGVLEGPLGERTFAMATSPADGDVWMATSAGLSRYSQSKNTWSHYTRAHGLPSVSITCLSFDKKGTLFIGTATEGIAISGPDTGFRKWRTIQGPHALPQRDRGQGLPGSMINDLVCGADGTVYAATTRGLARTRDGGETWSYLRGADWKEKLQGLFKPVDAEAQGDAAQLLREDYIACLTLDERGLLWIGYRQRGYEVRDPRGDRVLYTSASNERREFPYVSAILPFAGGGPLLGTYNQGLQEAVSFSSSSARFTWAPRALAPTAQGERAPEVPSLPSPAKAPTLQELQELLGEVRQVRPDEEPAPNVVALEDDWSTQGDWLGRYGRYYARLCAMVSPQDYVWGAARGPVTYQARIGPHVLPYHPGDSIRYYVHSLYTGDRRSLEMPPVYYDSRVARGLVKPSPDPAKPLHRRQAEIDDHGEEYPMMHDGPHLYASLRVPSGTHVLSLYDFNKDGHDGQNRMRDYRISIRQQPQEKAFSQIEFHADLATRPEKASGRIRDFWGGVWKRYLVSGPCTLTIEVNRNYSHNTILAGVFLDEISEEPTPYFRPPYFRRSAASPPLKTLAVTGGAASKEAKEAGVVEQLWRELDRVQQQNPRWWARERRRVHSRLVLWQEQAREQAPSAQEPTALEAMPDVYKRLGTSYLALGMFAKWEEMQRRRGLTPARDIEKALRWDKTESSGQGYAIITKYLQEQETRQLASKPPSKGVLK